MQLDSTFDSDYWNERWRNQQTGWDIGYPAPAITKYMEGVEDLSIAILIPGCGNAYEAQYLVDKGFTNITLIDIASEACNILQQKFKDVTDQVHIIHDDYFNLNKKFDLIIEQTFFCALPINKRTEYAAKSASILNDEGRIIGVLFNKEFDSDTPPFGGDESLYRMIFEPYFEIKKLELCHHSIPPRKDTELFINFKKRAQEVFF